MPAPLEKVVGRIKVRLSTANREDAGCSNCGRMDQKVGERRLFDGPLMVIEASDGATIRLCATCKPRVWMNFL